MLGPPKHIGIKIVPNTNKSNVGIIKEATKSKRDRVGKQELEDQAATANTELESGRRWWVSGG